MPNRNPPTDENWIPLLVCSKLPSICRSPLPDHQQDLDMGATSEHV